MSHLPVVAAVITDGSAILCVRRGPHPRAAVAHKWEFPGGKIEEGESDEAALLREIDEELSLAITVERHLVTIHHAYDDVRIELRCYLCRATNRRITLHEHAEHFWLHPNRLGTLNWAPADRKAVEYLRQDRIGTYE